MHTGKCCTLRIENTGKSGACSMPTGSQWENKDTNQRVQMVGKRKQHILALQIAWILIFFRRKQNSRANFPDFLLRFGGALNYNKHKASKYTAGNRYCADK